MVDSEPNDTQMDIDHARPLQNPIRSIEGWILLILNLHEETSEEDIQDKFADYGTITNLHLNLDRRTGFVKGYALIEYATQTEADLAIEETSGTTLLGQTIRVGYAFMSPPPPSEEGTRMDKNGEERDRSRSPERRD